jgi:alpha-tubulin suppressor-like RCC1 family protein
MLSLSSIKVGPRAVLVTLGLGALGALTIAACGGVETEDPPPTATAIASSTCESCFLHNKTLTCWGNEKWDPMSTGKPKLITLPGTPTQVAVGSDHVCANVFQKGIYCWGINDAGQLGVAIPDPDPSVPITTPTLSKMSALATKIVAGTGFTCGIINDTVKCMGGEQPGALGNGDYTRSVDAVAVPGLISVIDVGAGLSHACVIDKSNDVYCWGANDRGQAGQDKGQTDTVANAALVMVPKADKLIIGSNTSCAHTMDGDIWCWGANDVGQMGDAMPDTGMPRKTTLASYREVAMGTSRVYGVTQNSTIDYWGLVLTSSPDTTVAPGEAHIDGVNNVSAISAGPNHGCGISGANVYCWGDNTCNQLGGVSGMISSQPVKVL